MKTIVDINTGQVLFATSIDVDLQLNEIAIDNLLQDNFVNPYWNFDNSTFYENATEQQLEVEPTLPIANEIVIDLLTKQVETMSEEEKTDILQTLLAQ
jgi:hypothetical protein